MTSTRTRRPDWHAARVAVVISPVLIGRQAELDLLAEEN
jgi:hypothetical protein